jgi:O-antigen ligase
MKSKEDQVWENLLAQSASSFDGEQAPPYGLTTRILAAVREQRAEEALWERIGRRAIFASLAAVVGIALVTFVRHDSDDLDPAVKSVAVVENVQVS